jgi:RNA polymerase sigma-70 factor, ECF subfamily
LKLPQLPDVRLLVALRQPLVYAFRQGPMIQTLGARVLSTAMSRRLGFMSTPRSSIAGRKRGEMPSIAARNAPMAHLLQRIASTSDIDAFRDLYHAFGPRVKAYMIRQGADHDTAEELAQETLLTVWRKAGLYADDKGSASTWIFTIARNLRIDRLRREFPWQELPENHDETASDDTLPDEAASEHERQVRVQAALAELPQDQRDVVILSFIEGLSHSEIADRLDMPLGTVKSRIRLAYQKIRNAVEDLQ